MNAKERMNALIEAQPEDATYDEILRELVLARMVNRGLADSRDGRGITNEDMRKRISDFRLRKDAR